MPTATAAHILACCSEVQLGESPRWSPSNQLLYWVDIHGCAVFATDPVTGSRRTFAMPSEPGCVALRAGGGLVVALRSGIVVLDDISGSVTPLTAWSRPGIRFNDGRIDPAGRLWVGTIADDERHGAASLYRFDPDGSQREVLTGLGNANGIGWNPSGDLLYHIDTPTRRLTAWRFDTASGEIDDQRPVIDFSGEIGRPDGLAVDSAGMIWVALYGGSSVVRCDPRQGSIIDRIAVPGATNPTACALGGPRLDQLFITTATSDEPLAGNLFAAEVEIPGLPETPFAG